MIFIPKSPDGPVRDTPAASRIARHFGEKRRNFVGRHFWARGYFVSTVGRDEEVIRRCIQRQENGDRKLVS